MKSILNLIILMLVSQNTFSQSENYLGDWEGNIQLPGNGKLGVIFHISNSDNKLKCSMDVPMQGAKSIPAEKVFLEGNVINITYPNLKANYEGVLSDKTIEGKWSQNGQVFSLDLTPYTGKEELVRPQHPKPPFDYDIEEIKKEISNENETYSLAGTLTTPKGDGPFPLAVMVSGSGPQDRDESILGHKPFWVIADYLTKNGIAVFRYDDRGTAESTGDFASCTSVDFAMDALFMVNSFRAHPKINKDLIGIIGHSEGGLIAGMAAAKSPNVKFAIMLAGPGVPGAQILKKQNALIRIAEGEDESRIKREAQLTSDIIDIAAHNGPKEKRIESVRKKLKNYYDSNMSAEEKEEFGDFETFFNRATQGMFTDWMNYFLRTDPKIFIERINCPTLAIIGSNDLQVPAFDNIPALKASLEIAPTQNYRVEEIPNVNHLFQHSKTGKPSEYGELPETFAHEVLVMMRDWIKSL